MTKITKQQASEILNRYKNSEVMDELKRNINRVNRIGSETFRDKRAVNIQKAYSIYIELDSKQRLDVCKKVKKAREEYLKGSYKTCVNNLPKGLDGSSIDVLMTVISINKL